MDSSIKIFSIIVTYNGQQWIKKCLLSVFQSTVPVHVIVIDNASADDSVKIVRENFSDVDLIELEKNLGFGQANNIGLKKALEEGANYVLLLNQDAQLENYTIEKLVKVAKENHEYGILSPYHYDYSGLDIERYFKDWVLKHYTPGLKEDFGRNELNEVYPTQFVHAACWLMPLSTIEKVGGFDPLFFHYGEDNDYVQRLQFQSLKVGIVPSSIFYHHGTNLGLSDPDKKLWFQVNKTLTTIKDPRASLNGALFLFLKRLIWSQFSNDSVLARAYRLNFTRLGKIITSRKSQKKPLAYLS